MSDVKVIGAGYGHKIMTDDLTMYTSVEALGHDTEMAWSLFSAAVGLLSKLLDLPPEIIAKDLYSLSGYDMFHEITDSILKKAGKGGYMIPTLTELSFMLTSDLIDEHKDQIDDVDKRRAVYEKWFKDKQGISEEGDVNDA